MSDKLTCPHGRGTCYLITEVKVLRRDLGRAGEAISKAEQGMGIMIEIVESMAAERDQAKAAAIQWVTYDGMSASLPKQHKNILLKTAGADHTEVAYWFGSSRMWHFFGGGVSGMEEGDRWAYLPTPPEASE